jgi:hypothetical protein
MVMISDIVQILINILSGMFFGGVASLLGYVKGIEIPKWELDKLVYTVVIGGITFGIIGGIGLDLMGASTAITNYMAARGTAINALEVYALLSTIIAMAANQITFTIIRRTDVQVLFEKIKTFLTGNKPVEPTPVIKTDDGFTPPV